MPETNVRKVGVTVEVEVSGNTGQHITVKMVMWLPAFLFDSIDKQNSIW